MIKKIFIASIVLASMACKTLALQKNTVGNAPTWAQNAVIYEINTRQYSEAGTFAAVERDLNRIKDLGVDILWLMPIHPIGAEKRKGGVGSPYSVQNYQATHPDYGSIEDFKKLVKTAHSKGLKVIIDWVANHTAWDNVWMTKHPDWYAKDSAGNMYSPWDWTDVAQLNYQNKDMRVAMIEAMKYWVAECDIDGFRCDVAFLVPPNFWNEARLELQKVKPVFMLAEMETQRDIHPEPKDYFSKAFDACYGWDMHGTMHEVIKGTKPVSEWYKMMERSAQLSDTTWRMYFTSNHDENSWNGTEYEKFGANYKLASVLTYTMPMGVPLIYNGQDCANKKRLAFFEKDPIVWGNREMENWYKQMNQLKHNERALHNGLNGGKTNYLQLSNKREVFAYIRSAEGSSIITVVNLGKEAAALNKKTDIDWSKYELVVGADISGATEIAAYGYAVYKLKK